MTKFQGRLASPVLFVLAWVLMGPSAVASELFPGTSGMPPDVLSLGYSSSPPNGQPRTVAASTGETWGLATFTGGFYEQVEVDPANVFCSGCLDFLFQVSLDGTADQSLVRVTETGFSAYRTEAGYDSLSLGSLVLCGIDDGGFCNSGNPNTVPASVDRSLDGNTVGFTFPGIPTGDSTVDIVIETNALSYVRSPATFYGSNGATGTANIFGPAGLAVSAPEPSYAGLLLALVGAGVWYRKRRS